MYIFFPLLSFIVSCNVYLFGVCDFSTSISFYLYHSRLFLFGSERMKKRRKILHETFGLHAFNWTQRCPLIHCGMLANDITEIKNVKSIAYYKKRTILKTVTYASFVYWQFHFVVNFCYCFYIRFRFSVSHTLSLSLHCLATLKYALENFFSLDSCW